MKPCVYEKEADTANYIYFKKYHVTEEWIPDIFPHYHDSIEFVFMVGGENRIHINTQEETVTGGGIAFVRCFEPQLALTADDEGFSLIARAATALPAMLLPGGRAIFELSPHQAGRLTRLLEAKCRMRSTILRDYTGRDRFVTAEFIP